MYITYYDYGVLKTKKFEKMNTAANYIRLDDKQLLGDEGGYVHTSQIHSVTEEKPIITQG